MDSIAAMYRQSVGKQYAPTQNSSANRTASTPFNDLLATQLQATNAPKSLDDIFAQAAQTYHVPLNLLKAVGKAESGFNPDARSRSGAAGVMQLMPATAAALGVDDAFDAEQNIMGGAKYLGQMLDRYDGNVKLALAAYNAGSGNVAKYNGIPPFPETQNYVNKVLSYAGEDLTASTSAAASPVTKHSATTADFTHDDYLLFIQMIASKVASSGLSIATDDLSDF